jgi:hypothetical protein
MNKEVLITMLKLKIEVNRTKAVKSQDKEDYYLGQVAALTDLLEEFDKEDEK